MRSSIRKTLTWTGAGVGAFLAARAVARTFRTIRLDGRMVLITGGSRGLGLVLARQFIEEGAHVAICARDLDELERARENLAAHGADAFTVACDVTEREHVEWAVQTVLDHFGRIDILVNNAGIIQVGPFEVTTLEDYESALRTHFWAPLYTTLAVLPSMRRRGMGRIVNISSVGGKISVPHLLPYGASKFALTGLSEGLRAELAKDGIYVTTVIPGLMRTGSPPNALFKGQHRAEYAWFSISDALPVLSTSAERAARRIARACCSGDPELILTLPAHVAVRFHGLFPGLTTDLLSLTNRLLPGPGGIGTRAVKGRDSTSSLSPSWITRLSDEAAVRNNEIVTNGRHPHSEPTGEGS
jgi:NAD(P)-dependent dehydrogenase (short-subunit alcohol dehydrogenase family)